MNTVCGYASAILENLEVMVQDIIVMFFIVTLALPYL